MKEITRIDGDDVLNDVVARYPNTLPLLSRRGIDTCCGGAHRLREVARLHGLDEAELLGALNLAAASR